MIRWVLFPFLFLLSSAIFDRPILNAQDAGDVAFDTRADAAFGDATAALREFLRVRQARAGHRIQHFCIAGYKSRAGEEKRAWIHWTEGHEMILWRGAEPSENPEAAKAAKASIAHSHRTIDLTKDVVPTEADIKGSTYLVTRAWVDRLIADCQTGGVKYQISLK